MVDDSIDSSAAREASEVVIRSRRVVAPEGVIAATVWIADGRIVQLASWDALPASRSAAVIDAGDAVVAPGLVDTHVHVNEPGRTDWEGFDSATRAAAAGGVTTIADMPLNSIPATTTVAALEAKRWAAMGRCWVNVAFIGGVVPGNARELRPIFDGGAVAFKCFLVPSGVDEFPPVTERDLRLAFAELAPIGVPLMVHAELPQPIAAATEAVRRRGDDPRRYATYLATRPGAAEADAIATVLALAAEFGARVHIVHLSSMESLPYLQTARGHGVRVTVETCPHYLVFDAEDIPDGATEYKCAPPIRSRENREALWAALVAGDIDAIVSDHSPAPPELKQCASGDFLAAWGGIASLQLGLSAVWTEARRRGMALERVFQLMSSNPARIIGLGTCKGLIAPGYDADVIIFDPDAEREVTAEMLLHRHPLTPYLGRRLRGVVRETFIGGRALSGHPTGSLISSG
jgi:allantoinase